jgi:CheY-like chemotaxis protein
MLHPDTPEQTGTPSQKEDPCLREANEQLTLTALQARETSEELVHKQAQLRTMASQVLLVEQRERKRLSVDLHDFLGQLLVLGRIKIGEAGSHVGGADPFLVNMIGDLDRIFAKALDYTRTLIAELSPPVLYELGLLSALKWLGEEMAPRGLAVKVDVSHQQILLPEDQAVLLYQSVRELLLNVLRHAQTDHALVSVSLEDPGQLRLVVQDEGRGFDSTLLETLPQDRHFGLFMLRERMEAMGGSLTIDSVPGRGTTITLRLPIESIDESEQTGVLTSGDTPGTLPADGTSGTRRVLLVEDHAMVRQGLRGILERYDDVSVVGEAGNGIEALSLNTELMPDVIFMDVNMPQMDGIEATKRIKQARPEAIIIALSVNTSSQIMDAMKAAGASAFVSKESAVEELYNAMLAAYRSRG